MTTLRLAQHSDIPQVAEMMFQLKSTTGWSHAQHPGYNLPAITQFIAERLLDESSVVYVCSSGSDVVAFCGCRLGQLPWPPYLITIGEWGWAGPARESVRCWRACVQWGQRRGAGCAYRVSAQPGKKRTRITETVTWEVL